MAITSPYPAGAALGAGIFVTYSANTVVVATSGASVNYITTAPCAAGDYPDLALPGEQVWMTSSGTIGEGGLVRATTAGAAIAVTPTGAAATWTGGIALNDAANSRVLVLAQPQYHAAAS